jgi:hypothetical protein
LRSAAIEQGLRYGDALLKKDLADFINTMSEKPTAGRLNEQFKKSPPSEDLLLIPNMAARALADMPREDKSFDPSKYAIVANSITLSKLALLDGTGLAKITGRRTDNGDAQGNIMFRFARSIDGDYQWMEKAPPYARAEGPHDGNHSNGYQKGLILWTDQDLRDSVFRRIFIGPMSPSLHEPPAANSTFFSRTIIPI